MKKLINKIGREIKYLWTDNGWEGKTVIFIVIGSIFFISWIIVNGVSGSGDVTNLNTTINNMHMVTRTVNF